MLVSILVLYFSDVWFNLRWKKMILVKSSLRKVRFNPREVTLHEVMSHHSDFFSKFDCDLHEPYDKYRV